MCKQTCSEKNVSRLYFQSVGDPNDPSLYQKLHNREENPEELRGEVKKLEGKVFGLSSVLEKQQKDLKEVNVELSLCKEQVKKEAAMKDDAFKQKAVIQQLLHSKSKELDRSTLECMRLQERSMALAKELAALKLVSDFNLDEEEVLKLASLGKEANNKETIDVLKKSLVIRNKSYKELMAKCNALGRGDARSLIKLEKAKEKIQKLKTRVQELETAIEVKDNEALRALKGCKKSNCEMNVPNGVDRNSSSSFLNKCSSEDQTKGNAAPQTHLDQIKSVSNGLFSSRKMKEFKTSKDTCTSKSKDYVLIDEDEPNISALVHDFLNLDSAPQTNEGATVEKSYLSREGIAFDVKYNVQVHRSGSKEDGDIESRSATKVDTTNTSIGNVDDEVVLLFDSTHGQPLLNIKKDETSRLPETQPELSRPPVDSCFSGGLLGPDGNKWHLGKWCRRGKNKGSRVSSAPVQGSSPSMGNLIALGADGRGGRIKVLRSLNQASSDDKESSSVAKRCKYGAKTAQGCMQIEHFFARTGQ